MSEPKGNTGKFRTLGVKEIETAKRRAQVSKAPSKFDPYQGVADKPPSRKRDLRKIGEWLEARRRAEALKSDK